MKSLFFALLVSIFFIFTPGTCKSIYCHTFNQDLSAPATPVSSIASSTRTYEPILSYTSDPGFNIPRSIVTGIRGFLPMTSAIDFDVSSSIINKTHYQLTITAYSECGLRYLPTTVILSASSEFNSVHY